MTISKNMLLTLIVAIAGLLSTPAPAQNKLEDHSEEMINANRSIQEGRVKEGIETLVKLIKMINPTDEKDAYWRANASLIEILDQLGDYTHETQIINALVQTKIPESQPAYKQWMSFYLGRNFAYLHNPDEGEKFLHAVTQGSARLVHNPAQRAAALMLSKIELDRRNISQSAIWMRRAVIGTLVDQGASSEEIIDVLSAYAQFLTSIRRLSDANIIFKKLAPLYDQYLPKHGPKYLTFAGHYLFNLTALGYFQPSSENVLKILNDLVVTVDIPPDAVKGELYFQNLYKTARVPRTDAEHPIAKQLKTIAATFPDYLKQPQPRIQLAYYALCAGELDLADELVSAVDGSYPVDDQFASYDLLLRSFIAARRGKFEESVSLAQQGLERIRAFHRLAESESSARLPALGIEERLVLGLIVGMNAPHIVNFEQANALFQCNSI